MTKWIEVLKKLVDGPDVPIQGVIARSGPIDTARRLVAVNEVGPLYVAGVDDLQVWRDEPNIRVETMDGRPLVIFNGETVWRFAHHEPLPVEAGARHMSYLGPGRELLATQPASRWIGNDFTTPAGPIADLEYLGRPCWAVELAPPAHKPHAMQLVVDKRTGAILQQRNDGFGIAVQFIEFTAGIPIDRATFTWHGPTKEPNNSVAPDDFRSSYIPSQGNKKDEHRDWFARHVADRPLRIPIIADLSISHLSHHDENGSFDARIGHGAITGRLARRPRSTRPWDLLWDAPTVQAWCTKDHDWAIAMYTGELDPTALTVLQELLHPGEQVVGRPDIAS